MCSVFFFFKQKTADEMRISDWSSDVCSSDLNIVDDSYGDTVDTWTWRGQLRIDATPNLQFLISGDGLIGRENGSLGNVLTNSTGTTIDTVAPGRREISVSKIQLNDRTLWGTSLDAVLSLDSGHTLKSQTSYRDTKFHTALDPDYSA